MVATRKHDGAHLYLIASLASCSILGAAAADEAVAVAADAKQERRVGRHQGDWHGGWKRSDSSDGSWSSSSDGSWSSSSGKSGKSGGGGSYKCGKSGGRCSDSSSSWSGSGDSWNRPSWNHGSWGGGWNNHHGGKPGKHGGWGGGWNHQGWSPSSSWSSSSSSKGGKGSKGGKSNKWGKGGKGSSSTSSSSWSSSGDSHGGGWQWVPGPGHHGWGRPPAWGGHHGWGGWDADSWSDSTSWSSSSSTSTSSSTSYSGKGGKSGGGSGSSSSSWSGSDDGHDTHWEGDGWAGGGGGGGSSHSSDHPDDGWNSNHSDGWNSSPGWNADGWDNDGHYKSDIDYVRSHVAQLIADSDRKLIPKFLRLGFHDCVGGCDGCLDLSNPDNKGLEEPVRAIYPIVEKFKDDYSRADIWALATLVSADLSVVDGRPHGYHFPMRHIGRKDCDGASAMGVGGPEVDMPSNDFTTHELLKYFKDYFDFDADETVTIMGVHAVGVAHRGNIGFGNVDAHDGWVFDADSYELDNRYYGMLVGDEGDAVVGAPQWHMELVRNEGGTPDRYQWYHEKEGEEERPIMTNADMALVRDLKDYMFKDNEGIEGAVACDFKLGDDYEGYERRRRSLQGGGRVACPVASETMEKMIEYKMDNEMFLYDFEKVLEKMLKNGY